MKGFTKVVLILAAFSFLFGTAITVAAAALGGRMPREAVIDGRWEDGKWRLTYPDSFEYSVHDDLKCVEEYDLEDELDIMSVEGEALYDVESDLDILAEMSTSGCSKVELSVEAASVEIVEGKTYGSIYLTEAGEYIQCEQKVDDDTLEITVRRKGGIKNISWEDGRAHAVLVIPAGEMFHEMELSVGAGNINADTITANKLDLEAGAGSITIHSGNVYELNIDCAAGSVEYNGTVEQELEADCQAGSIELYLAGCKEDFNYKLEVSMGNIEIDGETYRSFETEKHFNNEGAVKKAELECEVGNIQILFDE